METHVFCAISGKEIQLQNLNYWNVELQEAYFSPNEANERLKYKKNSLFPPVMCPDPLTRIFIIIFSRISFNFL